MSSQFDFGNADEDTEEELREEAGVEEPEQHDYVLHDNVAKDLVKYSRSCIAKNEEQFLLTTLGYLSGLMESPGHYISGVIIGTSSSGKTHMQNKVERLFPEKWMYNFTTGSDQTIAYDEEWDEKLLASLDEMNKPSQEIVEVLKSLHGDDESFKRKVVEDWRNEKMKTLEREAMPYWFLFAQYDSDFELWNRLLKIPVHEGKAKNRAVLRMQFDHHNIEFDNSDYTYDFEFTEGTEAIQDHIKSIRKEFPDGAWVKLPAGEEEFDGLDVANVLEPIFDVQRSETNRVGAMVANLVRASALLNYKNREVRKIHVPNEGIKDAVIAEPEDVANILACRDVLAASTHEIDRKKKAICTALESKGGGDNRASIPEIMEHLRQTNAPIVKRNQVEKILGQMIENHLVEKHERTGENGRNEYEFAGWHNIGRIDINNKFKELFSGVESPIDHEDIVDVVREQNENLEPGPKDYISDVEVDSVGGGDKGQATLTEETIELEPHEEAVRESLYDTLNNREIDISENEPTYYEMLGAVDMGDKTDSPDTDGTLFDPDHGVWNRQEVEGWVDDKDDAFDAIDDTLASLNNKGVFQMTPIEQDNGQPTVVEVSVKSKDEL